MIFFNRSLTEFINENSNLPLDLLETQFALQEFEYLSENYQVNDDSNVIVFPIGDYSLILNETENTMAVITTKSLTILFENRFEMVYEGWTDFIKSGWEKIKGWNVLGKIWDVAGDLKNLIFKLVDDAPAAWKEFKDYIEKNSSTIKAFLLTAGSILIASPEQITRTIGASIFLGYGGYDLYKGIGLANKSLKVLGSLDMDPVSKLVGGTLAAAPNIMAGLIEILLGLVHVGVGFFKILNPVPTDTSFLKMFANGAHEIEHKVVHVVKHFLEHTGPLSKFFTFLLKITGAGTDAGLKTAITFLLGMLAHFIHEKFPKIITFLLETGTELGKSILNLTSGSLEAFFYNKIKKSSDDKYNKDPKGAPISLKIEQAFLIFVQYLLKSVDLFLLPLKTVITYLVSTFVKFLENLKVIQEKMAEAIHHDGKSNHKEDNHEKDSHNKEHKKDSKTHESLMFDGEEIFEGEIPGFSKYLETKYN